MAFSNIACHGDGAPRPAYMRWYGRYVFPYLEIMATSRLGEVRQRLMRHAQGRVVEIGAGAGQNLDYLPEPVHSYIATDPSPVMVGKARKKMRQSDALHFSGRVIESAAEEMPFENETADTAISFLVLCSVHDSSAALSEIHRVLKPGGRLLFFEHVRAQKQSTVRWQNRINPLWKQIACGCNLNRTTSDDIEQSGFAFKSFQRYRTPKMGPAITSHVIEGVAVKKT